MCGSTTYNGVSSGVKENLLKRRRRTKEQAREEILSIAEDLLATQGPEAVRLEAIARKMGVSHPTVLHHFGTMEGVLAALHHRVSHGIRERVLGMMSSEGGATPEGLERALAALADPKKGRLLAWLVATGRDPFPPAEEQGMSSVVDALHQGPPEARILTENVVLLAVLAMMGDALVGDAVRARLAPAEGTQDRPTPDAGAFRRWLLQVLGKSLPRGPES